MATQVERNAATRDKLRQSALAQLVKFGYAGTNASLICEGAGVTRGALNHQYPEGKFGLIADLVSSLYAKKVQFLYGDGDREPMEVILSLLDSLYQDPASQMQLVIMDLWLSMRGDPKLTAIVGPVFMQGNTSLWRCFDQAKADKHTALAELVRTFVLGLSMNRLNPDISADMARGQVKLMQQLIKLELSVDN